MSIVSKQYHTTRIRYNHVSVVRSIWFGHDCDDTHTHFQGRTSERVEYGETSFDEQKM